MDSAATVAKARLRAVTGAPLLCSLPSSTQSWDLAFVADRNAAAHWPLISAAVPFIIDRTGASVADTRAPPKFLAAVQLGAVDATATLDVVVVEVASGQLVCEGRLSGAVDARAAGGVSRSIDVLLMGALLPGWR